MKILLAALFVATAIASDVIELDDGNFASGSSRELMLIEFYAPWCGHCKKLAPEYEKAATALLKNDPPVPIAKVDCTASTETCGKFGVTGYPTLKIFRNGEVAEDYNGPREADGIVRTMKSKAGPSSKNLDSLEVAEKFMGVQQVAVVGFFDSQDSDLAKNFKKAADAMSEKHRFAYSVNEEVNKKHGYFNQIVLFYPSNMHSKFEDKFVVYDGSDNVVNIKSFVSSNAFGLCGERTMGNAGDFGSPVMVAYYDVDYIKNPKGSNYWRNRVMKVAKKMAEAGTLKKITYAVSNANEFSQEMEELGLSGFDGKAPKVAIKDAKGQKFPMEDEFSMDNLEKFLTAYAAGNLEPFLKSEPVPDNSNNAVKVAVAKNFEELVNDSERDVLIEFYAPWCGHCKSLEPKYNELAEKLADENGITIAKMDATANDVPTPYDVRGFPTIYFAPKGNKSNPKKYEGGREVEDFIKYLAREATTELKGYDRKGNAKKTEL